MDFYIVSDIDGVFIIGLNAIPGSATALKFISKTNIPLLMLTNNGICTESDKTTELNNKLQLAPEYHLSASQMLVCHTFMGS